MTDKEIQRREHVRVPVDIECPVSIPKIGRQKVRVIDLSGGGCSCISDHEFSVGDHLFITVPFDDWTLEAELVVRFTRPVPAGNLVGAMFFDVTKTMTDQIVREVFRLLRIQLQQHRS